MGISGFFPKFIKKLRSNVIQNVKPEKIKGLCFDMNGMIHPIAQKVFMYGGAEKKFEENKAFYAKTSSAKTYEEVKKERSYKSYESLENEFYTELSIEILRIINYFKPYEFIILAVDGIAPLAKISQQRTRRFKPTTESPLAGFNGSMISPGTPFMKKLDAFISNIFIPQKLKNTTSNVVIYSSYKIPGEGEHKIFERLRTSDKASGYFYDPTNSDPIMLWGLDNDLLMLSCISPTKNIYVAKERFDEIAVIEVFKNLVVEQMLELCEKKDYLYQNNFDTLLKDFTVIANLLGNDFLPSNFLYPYITDSDVYGAYNQTLKEYDYKVFGNTGDDLNFKFLFTFFKYLSLGEKSKRESIKNSIESGKTKYLEPFSPLYAENYDTSLTELVKKLYNIEHSVYGTGAPEFTIKDFCSDYLNGFLWIFKYYTQGIFSINTTYTFPYLISPSFSLIVQFLTDETSFLQKRKQNVLKSEMTEEYYNYNINEGEQLLAILPNSVLSKQIFNNEIKKGGVKGDQYSTYVSLTGKDGPLRIFSQEGDIIEFKEGKQKDYEAVPILNRVDFNFMKKRINELYEKKTTEALTKVKKKVNVDKEDEIEERKLKIIDRAENSPVPKKKGIYTGEMSLLWGKEDHTFFERIETSKIAKLTAYVGRKPFLIKGEYSYFVKMRKLPPIIPAELNESISLEDLEISTIANITVIIKNANFSSGVVAENVSPKTSSKLIDLLEKQRDSYLKRSGKGREKNDMGFEFFTN